MVLREWCSGAPPREDINCFGQARLLLEKGVDLAECAPVLANEGHVLSLLVGDASRLPELYYQAFTHTSDFCTNTSYSPAGFPELE
jgi:hypothetical protein